MSIRIVTLLCKNGHMWDATGILDDSGFTPNDPTKIRCPECNLEAEGMA